MAADKPGAEFLTEFRAFLTFVETLWGLLASMSVFFPLSEA
jgi:hypothetical protein